MIKNLYFKIPRRMRILIVFLLIVAAAWLIIKTLAPETKNTPKEFLEARQEASLVAKNIIDISGRTAENIKKISDLDKNKEYTEALNLISEELNNNRLARENAINLSAKLGNNGEKRFANIAGNRRTNRHSSNQFGNRFNQPAHHLQRLPDKTSGNFTGEIFGKRKKRQRQNSRLN